MKIKDDANRPKNVCFNGLLADADPCRLCRDVYMGKLGWARLFIIIVIFVLRSKD